MAQKKLTEFSTEELTQREKALKTSIAVMGGAIALMIAAGAYLTIRKGFGVFTVLPIVFISLFVINFKNLKDIRAELASRNG